MTVSAVLFDLGGTLARYYARHEFPAILRLAVEGALSALADAGMPAPADLWARIEAENHEAPDYCVRPLAHRLERAFGLPGPMNDTLCDRACRAFLRPILALGVVYEDAIPVLRLLRSNGVRTAIVSNTPWGSPGDLWREELERLGLAEWVDTSVFCADVGWRKPDERIFWRALDILGVGATEAAFVGDDPRWDIAGPAPRGIRPILLQRCSAAAPRPSRAPTPSRPWGCCRHCWAWARGERGLHPTCCPASRAPADRPTIWCHQRCFVPFSIMPCANRRRLACFFAKPLTIRSIRVIYWITIFCTACLGIGPTRAR